MDSARFGELLGRLVPLSGHDVAEILEEQELNHRRFGQIALDWGLCRPQHVWRVWWAQLANKPDHVDLDSIGIDTQALTHLSGALAREFGVIPVRALGNQIVLAGSQKSLSHAREKLPPLLPGRQIQFVLADERQINAAIARIYPVST